MEDLERRAMLGDLEAQRVCTEQGILLLCPWCNGEMEVCHGDDYGYYKTKCVLCGAESPEQPNEWSAISRNNTRPAPPIGRCKDCAYYDDYRHCKLHSAEPDQYSPGHYVEMQPDDFCSYFEPREGEAK